ncbi:MAG: GNAT family N-acetyltransferase [Xanthomonadaceae bacterium]|nr:GNAT family N-acetyltransferase [Xanthomonadaceae bacterium]
MAAFAIRDATRDDVPLLLAMIRRLAEYERLLHEVVATEDLLREHLFDAPRGAAAVIAEEAGTPVGMALYFHNFSTFLGRPGLYLEDLFVVPEARGRGYGKALMVHLARVAKARGCGRFEWWVLDWNRPAIDFYRSIGAVGMDEWTVQRVAGAALDALAAAPLPGEGAD